MDGHPPTHTYTHTTCQIQCRPWEWSEDTLEWVTGHGLSSLRQPETHPGKNSTRLHVLEITCAPLSALGFLQPWASVYWLASPFLRWFTSATIDLTLTRTLNSPLLARWLIIYERNLNSPRWSPLEGDTRVNILSGPSLKWKWSQQC